jgi:hypothetical protein
MAIEIDQTHPKPLLRAAVSAKILTGWRPYSWGDGPELFTLVHADGKVDDGWTREQAIEYV